MGLGNHNADSRDELFHTLVHAALAFLGLATTQLMARYIFVLLLEMTTITEQQFMARALAESDPEIFAAIQEDAPPEFPH